MNQSELIDKVAQATKLNQAAAGQAVKAVANAILDALLVGEVVRVSGLGIFNVAARPARQGRNPQTGETIQIAASKAVRFHAGKAVKDALNPPTAKVAPRKKTASPKKIRGTKVNVLSSSGRGFAIRLAPFTEDQASSLRARELYRDPLIAEPDPQD
jgi:DNA-binding protein HU-beta